MGGKAANLGELLKAGMRVPDGVVLSNCGKALPTQSDVVLDAAVRQLGDGPFAVRSSGIAEDGTEGSFACVFSSLLDVRPAEISAAANKVLAGVDTERVVEGNGRAPGVWRGDGR